VLSLVDMRRCGWLSGPKFGATGQLMRRLLPASGMVTQRSAFGDAVRHSQRTNSYPLGTQGVPASRRRLRQPWFESPGGAQKQQ